MVKDTANVQQLKQLSSEVNAWKAEQGRDGAVHGRPTGITIIDDDSSINSSGGGSGGGIRGTRANAAAGTNAGSRLLEERVASPFGFYTSDTTPTRILTVSDLTATPIATTTRARRALRAVCQAQPALLASSMLLDVVNVTAIPRNGFAWGVLA